MCGILLLLSRLISNLPPHKISKSFNLDIETELTRRGPDIQGKLEKNDVVLIASVLHLRGADVTQQPVNKNHVWLA